MRCDFQQCGNLNDDFFQILPVLVFFSALIEVLYHVGAMQIVISAIAALLQLTMKTTPIESFATAAHIFIGQVVAKFLIIVINIINNIILMIIFFKGFFIYLRNKFNFWKVYGIMNTSGLLQSK